MSDKAHVSGGSIGLLGEEIREKLFDRRPIFCGSVWVLVFSERRGSMDARNLRDKLGFFGGVRGIENGFRRRNLFWILS
jgi:hypothetical protein